MISCPENFDFPHVLFSFHRSCRYKGLAGEKPRATCDIKIKIRQSNAAESVTPPTPTQCPNAHTVPPRLHAHPVPPRLHAHPVLPRPPSAPTPPRPSSAPTPPRPSSAPTPPRPSSAPTPPRLHAHPGMLVGVRSSHIIPWRWTEGAGLLLPMMPSGESKPLYPLKISPD
ncbi:homeobox protein ESX1-like isoform X3 [Eriocheir sinensis]|uniref:homeobox protein ESX1-like isoform X3 n=1 Tax=Eriocheir sinensis TaxID=95602 RepID=UPI0021C90172|nr:homeobox protein ESX1-like isoform X3 [Eriocheir sinensis]